jgi:mRNA interferase RelE/StbE
MNWTIDFDDKARKALLRIEKNDRQRIVAFLERLSQQDNPRQQGKALTGKYTGSWRYRVGDYRIICNIRDKQLTILILQLGQRKNVY